MKIGILAIQGSVIEHKRMLERLGVQTKEIRLLSDLDEINGIILPGGESTTISKLLKRFGLFDELKKRIKSGLPVWGTCAGAILLSKKAEGLNPSSIFAVMDINSKRNAYGRHADSFEADLKLKLDDQKIPFHGVFIRAPKIQKISKSGALVLAKQGDDEVMLRQGNILATTFHPELTDDEAVHRYFVGMCSSSIQ